MSVTGSHRLAGVADAADVSKYDKQKASSRTRQTAGGVRTRPSGDQVSGDCEGGSDTHNETIGAKSCGRATCSTSRLPVHGRRNCPDTTCTGGEKN